MRLLERVIGFVAPYDCLACGDEGAILCEFCRFDQISAPPSRCAGCLTLTDEYKTCQKCQPRLRAGHIWVASEYQDVARELVRTFKFNGARAAARAMAKAIAEATPQLDAKEWLVVPIPTITKHQRMRGFDHSRLLGRHVAQYKKLTFEPLLGRLGQTRQVGAARTKRERQIAGSMFVRSAPLPKRTNILLVDDVMTTGASIAEATRALKAAGAKKVYAAVFAQKVL